MKKILCFVFVTFLFSNCFPKISFQLGGGWIVESEIQVKGVINSDESEKIIGKTFFLTQDYLIYENHSYSIKSIKEDTITSEMLYLETKGSESEGITFKDLGIEKRFVHIMFLKFKERINLPVKTIIILDNENLIGIYENHYYQLKKIYD